MSEDIKQNFAEGNNFYIFGKIREDIAQEIIKPLQEKVNELSQDKEPNDLNIYLNSCGGWTHESFEIVSIIEEAKKKGIKVNTYCRSKAMSGAFIIFITGSKRYVTNNSVLMTHFCRSWDFSDNPVMTDRNKEYTDFINQKIVDHINKYTEIKDVDEKMIPDNYFIFGEDAIEKGCADEII